MESYTKGDTKEGLRLLFGFILFTIDCEIWGLALGNIAPVFIALCFVPPIVFIIALLVTFSAIV